jgi:hypothetical protein
MIQPTRFAVLFVCVLAVAAFVPGNSFAQVKIQQQPKLNVLFSISSLGFGAQVAKPLPHRSDVRGGFNFYRYSNDLTDDGIHYAAEVKLQSVNIQFDKYLVGGLFVSGGALVWNGNKADANTFVPGGNFFRLGDRSYYSDPAAPVHGQSDLTFRTMAPMVTLGFGNLTSKGRIAYSVEAGVAFHGTPAATMSLAGSACDFIILGSRGIDLMCKDAATDPIIQSNVAAQQQQINDDISNFKYYPILQFSIGYKF